MQAAEERLQAAWPNIDDIQNMKDQNQPDEARNKEGMAINKMDPNIIRQQAAMSRANKRTLETNKYYTECYPGMAEMQDAIDDSDDEADYTKMDLGNKKGPVGRWDFDTQEEYSDYMNQREAMPKAAFQYGVKMADGRKTRRIGPNKDKDKNIELNREWQQIQQILKRRSEAEMTPSANKRTRYEY